MSQPTTDAPFWSEAAEDCIKRLQDKDEDPLEIVTDPEQFNDVLDELKFTVHGQEVRESLRAEILKKLRR